MAIKTWNGGGTTDNFSDGGNWGGTAPVAGDALVFDGSTRLTPVNDQAISYLSITFAATAGDFTISNNSLTITGGSISNSKTTGLQTISANVIFSTTAPTINTATGGSLTISGTVNYSTFQLSTTGGGLLTVSGNISGSGLVYINCGIDYYNIFSGASNAFTGAVTINSGGLQITNNNGLGTGTKTITIVNGTTGEVNLRLDGSGGDITLGSNLSFSTSCVATPYGCIYNVAGNNVINGTFSLTSGGGGTRFEVNAGTLTLNGVITAVSTGREIVLAGTGNGTFNGYLAAANSPTIRKEGSGTWTLTGNSLTTGAVSLNNGTVYANGNALGNGALTVTSPAVLRVAGTAGTDGGRGILARYYSMTTIPNDATSNTISSHINVNNNFRNTPANLVTCDVTMNKATNGSAFPPPYNTGNPTFHGIFRAKLVVAVTGTYTFDTNSDDGSMLYIGTTNVVSNNGGHGMQVRTGTIALTAGTVYDLTIGYYNSGGGYGLQARISGADNTTMTELTSNSTVFFLRTLDLVTGPLSGNGTIHLDSGDLITHGTTNTAWTGTIDGAFALEKSGTGVLTVTGTQSYTGVTIVHTGAGLTLGNGTADPTFSSGGIIVGGPVIFNTTADWTYDGFFAGISTVAGTITKSGTATLTLTDSGVGYPIYPDNYYTMRMFVGAVTISTGSVKAGGVALGMGPVTVNSGAYLKVDQTGIAAIYSDSSTAVGNMSSHGLFINVFSAYVKSLGNMASTLYIGTNGVNFPGKYKQVTTVHRPTFTGFYCCRFTPQSTGTYTFRLGSDDNSMLWIDNTLVINNNTAKAYTTVTGTIALTSGVTYDLMVSFSNTGSDFGLTLEISGANNTTYVHFDTSNANTVIGSDLFIGGLLGSGEVQCTSGNIWIGDATSRTFTGLISGVGGIRKWRTNGQFLTTTTETYTGTTEVWVGTLVLNTPINNGTVNVHRNGTLSGNSTIPGNVVCDDTGIIDPGAIVPVRGVAGIAQITISGNVTIPSPSDYRVDLNGVTPTFDKIAVTGTLTLGGDLTVANFGLSTTGKVYTIASFGTLSGLFNGKADASTFRSGNRTLRINYNATDITLTDVGNWKNQLLMFME